ncbi:MFS transporter [Roseomonas elaeocarpi]|uniref:MFS transporter n=1 Tax=Roseomonas elaeocarpi TaxID=907779 RepID=A0ABV6JSI0_9PROT
MNRTVPAEGGKPAEFRHGWPALLAATVGCAMGLSSLPFYSLGSFIAPLQAEFGWGRGDVASSFLYTTVVLALVSPLLGGLIDRVGVRPVALVSIPLLAAVLFAISRFEGSVTGFHLLYALAGLVGSGATPINYTRAVNAAFDRGRGLALGISLAGIGVAAFALPPLLAWIIQAHGWRTAYLTLAVLALLPWPFALLGLREGEAARSAVLRDGASVAFALRSGTFWVIGLGFAAIAVAVSALVVHITPLLRDAGLDAMAAARIASVIGIGVLGGRILAGYVIDRFFAPFVAAAMFLATALGCLLLLLGGPALAPVAAVLVGLSLGAEVDLIAYLTARYFGMARYGFLYALIYAMFAVGAAVGPAAAGTLFDLTGSYTVPLWCVIALLAVSSLAIAALPRFDAFTRRWQGADTAAGLPAAQPSVL